MCRTTLCAARTSLPSVRMTAPRKTLATSPVTASNWAMSTPIVVQMGEQSYLVRAGGRSSQRHTRQPRMTSCGQSCGSR
jgi:hypothetical protein